MSDRVTRELVIYTAADRARIRELTEDVDQAAVAAASTGRARMGGSPARENLDAAALALDEFVAESAPRGTKVVVMALGSRDFRNLRRDCPPREGNPGDAQVGFNQEAMGDRLPYFWTPTSRTVVEPLFESEAAVTAWLDELSDGDFAQVYDAAHDANAEGSPRPKASMTSLVEQRFNALFESPATTG